MACLAMAGCNSKDSTKPEFTDELTLGTGIAGFDLVSESTTFHGTPVSISFRLESSEDFQGSAIEIRVEKDAGGGYTSYRTLLLPEPAVLRAHLPLVLLHRRERAIQGHRGEGVLRQGHRFTRVHGRLAASSLPGSTRSASRSARAFA